MLSSLMVTAHCTGVRYFQNPMEDFQLEASRNHFDSTTPPLEQQIRQTFKGVRLPEVICSVKASVMCIIMRIPFRLLFIKTLRNVVPIKGRKKTNSYT